MILNTSFKKVFTDKISSTYDHGIKRIIKEYQEMVKGGYEGFQLFGYCKV